MQQYVSEITSETAENFRFDLQQFLKREAFIDSGGVQLADGGWLIISSNGTAGKEEFYRYFYIAFILNFVIPCKSIIPFEKPDVSFASVNGGCRQVVLEYHFVKHCPQSIV